MAFRGWCVQRSALKTRSTPKTSTVFFYVLQVKLEQGNVHEILAAKRLLMAAYGCLWPPFAGYNEGLSHPKLSHPKLPPGYP